MNPRFPLSTTILAAASALSVLEFARGESQCAIPSTSAYLEPQAPDPAGQFGFSVAIDGDWIAVGVPGGPARTGRVELFQRSNGAWLPGGVVAPADGTSNDDFGTAVAIQGGTLLVGAPGADGIEARGGAAYVFQLVEGAWLLEAKLAAPGPYFGGDVDLDGDHALVGSTNASVAAPSSGAAYLFVKRDNEWGLAATLAAPDGASGDNFGRSVAISDGVVAIGAPFDDVAGMVHGGSVRIFESDNAGWHQAAVLSSADTPLMGTALFGFRVAWRGSTLLVGRATTGMFLSYDRIDGGWSNPRLIAAPGAAGGSHSLRLCPSSDIAIMAGWTSALGLHAAVLRRDEAGWYAEQVVGPPVPLPLSSSTTVACDETSLVLGARFAGPGVPKGVAFVAELPPPDRDQDGLDDACELESGLSEDCDRDGRIDDAQIPCRYAVDGSPSGVPTALTVNGPSPSVLALNHFSSVGTTREVIRSIGFIVVSFPGEAPVDEATVVVYSDPDNDGNPMDALLLSAQPVVLPPPVPVGLFMQSIPIEPVDVGPPGSSFFVGLAMNITSGQPFSWIDDGLPHRQASWFAFSVEGPLDLVDLSVNPPTAMEFAIGGTGSPWQFPIRAERSDCDGDSRIDACQIVEGELVDHNDNGVPDLCEVILGDLDGNGIVNGDDLASLLAAWGSCGGEPACLPDLDGDGAIDGRDLGLLLAAWSP